MGVGLRIERLYHVFSLQSKTQCGKTSAAEDYAQEIEKEREEKTALQKERDLLRKVTAASVRMDKMMGLLLWAKLAPVLPSLLIPAVLVKHLTKHFYMLWQSSEFCSYAPALVPHHGG